MGWKLEFEINLGGERADICQVADRVDPADRRRFEGGMLLAVLLAASVGIFTVVFARSDQVARIATDAEILATADEVVVNVSSLRASLGMTLVLASAEENAIAVQEGSASAAEVVRTAADSLEASVTDLVALAAGSQQLAEVEAGSLSEAMWTVRQQVDDTLVMIEDGDLNEADALARAEVLPGLDELNSRARELAGRSRGIIASEGADGGKAARLASVFVALAAPAITVWAVRTSMRRRARRELLESELAAERRINQARGDLIAGLSHQLRTPLTGIVGFAAILRDATSDPMVLESAITIYANAMELRRMVDDFLVAARLDAGGLEFSSEVVEVAEAVDIEVEPYLQLGVSIAEEIEEGSVTADRLRLQHLVRNLVANAVAHGGPEVVVEGRHLADHYRLTISDDGPGVPADLADRLFQPFMYAGREALLAGSLGMGLAVAKVLADGMGSSLRYERREGRTLFTVELPLAQASAELVA